MYIIISPAGSQNHDTIHGKIWSGKILANLANFPANIFKYSETTEYLPSDPPKYSLPFATLVSIHDYQNFNLPTFSRVR